MRLNPREEEKHENKTETEAGDKDAAESELKNEAAHLLWQRTPAECAASS